MFWPDGFAVGRGAKVNCASSSIFVCGKGAGKSGSCGREKLCDMDEPSCNPITDGIGTVSSWWYKLIVGMSLLLRCSSLLCARRM